MHGRYAFVDHDVLRQWVAAVNRAFYERVYQDPWLAAVFRDVPREHIERQQTDFMVGALGGPRTYSGRSPSDAHPHIYVDEDMWQQRERFLREAFAETKLPEELSVKWLRIDEAFKTVILKRSLTECTPRYTLDEIIYVENPNRKKAS